MSASVLDLKFATIVGTPAQVEDIFRRFHDIATATVVDGKYVRIVLTETPITKADLSEILVNARIVEAV